MKPTRLVRIDDFPYGRPQYDPAWCLRMATKALGILNEYGVSYMLGVIPAPTTDEQAECLCGALSPNGRVCMHGFDHGFSLPYWPHMTKIWPRGGEFVDMSTAQILAKLEAGDRWLDKHFGTWYAPEHFIAPFNTYTQAAVDAMQEMRIVYLHTCDKEFKNYRYADMDYGGITPVISQYNKTYAFADTVIRHLDNGSQLTLHWMFDVQRKEWEYNYHALGRALRERADAECN